ncbi:GntR family transcriptional regulator [Acidisoma cellulosilytica]|uniref:GntR family transcriptional regulator n=1 Tax=Acidisoma cellulosilyticum TaxID=2802395 RepID=A0A963Z213_9PROT|nr:GntR family transcriptional regulator [Acidisoma cellulosilyticum]MCB8881079.1 GntR family transcriptional regulator [Acidisoma cellulosilyticum]
MASAETEDRQANTRSDARLAAVVSALQHDIVFGRLKPRERLVEEELSERFAVGRHVIRAALDELDRNGLVRRRQNRGAVVSDYSPEEVDELYDIRAILQREAARRVPLPASPDFIATLIAVNDDYVRCGKAGDLDKAAIANDQFHQLIFNECRNRHLAELIQQYWIKTAAIHCYAIANPSLADQSREEHALMIQAMRIGDRESFETLSVDHMQPALAAFKAAHGGWISRNTTG